MRPNSFVSRLLFALSICLMLFACANPPTFTWPDKIPELDTPPAPTQTPFDRWKAARMVEPNPVLIAGAAAVDLTPVEPQRIYIAGYMANKKARGVLSPITGRVFVLDDGENTLVMINLDFVGFMHDAVWRARHAISKQHADNILIASTHTHAGPDTMGMWGPALMMMLPVGSGVDKAYMRFVNTNLVRGVQEAIENAQPVDLFASEIKVPEGISYNSHQPGYKDDIMSVLQARTAKGTTVATLVNYTCHAEFMGQNNAKLSADFPGYLYPELERLEGGVALYFNGAVGGIIVPAMPRYTEIYVRLREKGAIRAGKTLARYASQAVQSAEKLEVDRIQIRQGAFRLPIENSNLTTLGKMGIFTRSMEGGKIKTEVWRIDLGELTMLSVPGEIFPSLGFLYKAMMPGRYHMLLGLANDEVGYIMTEEEWDDPNYAYEITVSPGRSSGPMLTQAVRMLFPDAPEDPDIPIRDWCNLCEANAVGGAGE